MKQMVRAAFIFLLLVAVCLGSGIVVVNRTGVVETAEKRGRLLSRNEAATTWIGITEDELYLVRLELLVTGEAKVAYSFLDEQLRMLHGMSWSYDPSRGSAIWIGPTGSGPGLTLRGDIVGVKMDLVISDRDWRRKVTLRREAELEARWGRLRDTMK